MNSPITNSNESRRIFTFAEFSFDAEKRILWRGAETVSLAPKACELLGVLIENAPQVLSKEDLMNLVWHDSFVEEANLTHHISALRKALGEDKKGRKFIETIPRKGYRFVAETKKLANAETAEIVVKESAFMRAIEETIIESNDLPDRTETVPLIDIAPKAVKATRKTSRRVVWTFATAISVLLIGAAFFAYRNYSSVKTSAPPEIIFKRLTPDADATAPSVSPDGLSIAFVRNENGQHSLWRKTIASGEMTQLTPDVSMMKVEIGATRFSPDGRWIYYTQILDDETEKALTIYRIPANGGAAQKILQGLDIRADFSISPDGKQIAYTFDWRQLIVADIETGSKRVVAERDGTNQVIPTPGTSVAWSPDGSRLIFAGVKIEDNQYIRQLFEFNLLTGLERPLPIDENFGINQIEWLADDSGLIVTSGYKIWRLDYRTGAKSRLSNETDEFNCLRMSADSKIIVAQQLLGQFNIWTAPADNIDKRRQITVGGAARQGLDGLAITPAGKILYTSTESGTNDIWIMNEDGSERRQLTVNAGNYNSDPSPTKDGRYIVFQSTRSGTNQIWRMDADGGNPVQLSTGLEHYSVSLSPESDVYFMDFQTGEQKYQIYKVSITGGEPVKIDDYYSVSGPQFSPDGKWILFWGGKTKDEKPRVGIIERATGKIVRYFANNFSPRGWSPDSKSNIDTMNRGQELWRQPVDGSAPEKIYDVAPLKIARWDFSADGKRVVFSLGNSTSEIVTIKNFSGQQ